MSYGFTVVKSGDSIQVEPLHPSAVAHIPDGRFAVAGHVPAEGTSKVANLSVTLTKPSEEHAGFNEHVGSASATYVV